MISPEFQEKARACMVAFRRKRRNGKNVGQFGLLGNYYDAFIFAYRARIGIFKKNATYHFSRFALKNLSDAKGQRESITLSFLETSMVGATPLAKY